MKDSTIRIDPRFRGPPDSGNGGYSAGLLAQALGGLDVEVTLRLPPPLGRDLRVEAGADDAALYDGDALVASAVRAPLALDVPPPPAALAARAAETRFTGFERHIFPGCFVCGPDRDEGDGLRIFPGAADGASDQVAALWTPDPAFEGEDGRVALPFLWAALDCPGYFAVEREAGRAVLGRMRARIEAAPPAGAPLIVTGWAIGHDGRKHRAGTALHDKEGRLVAAATATWISLA